jgi:signal transduction histidine kinase
LPTEEFVQQLLHSLVEVCGCDRCELVLQEADNFTSVQYETSSERFALHQGLTCDTPYAAAFRAAWEGIPPAHSRTLVSPSGSFLVEGLPQGSTPPSQLPRVLVPFRLNSSFRGLLVLENPTPDKMQEDVELLEEMGQSLAVAVVSHQTQAALRERVKELTCLHGMAKLAAQTELSLDELLQQIVRTLPAAWRYPEIASARIMADGQIFSTPSYQQGNHSQREEIVVRGTRRGFVEVTYAGELPELAGGPFLEWETRLIQAVAGQLSLIIERRTSEQEKAKLELQLRHADRLATIGQLAAGVAHELNEPLANVLGFSQLARKTPDVPEQTVQDLGAIERAALHAREVIRKLMYFSRQMPQRITPVALNDVIDDGLFFLASRCDKAGVSLTKDLAPDLPDIKADGSQLQQVLVNLVVNALQAMEEGGSLKVSTRAAGESLVLEVRDTGQGMSEEVRRQAFVPFFTTKDVDQGTGLGLPVVHGIVSAHGGTIALESDTGQGTTVRVVLPLVSDASDADDDADATEADDE